MLGHEKEQKSLTRKQKEAIGLLSIGTFLEYFDLMLYVHMAVLLNNLFFPKADPDTAALYSAIAFCSTFVVRPVGALIFGWIGDNIGRKPTVVLTTIMMAFSCFIMANLQTHAEIGITATVVVTICRILQGLSSMGEVIGAELYVTEITKPPVQYPSVALIPTASTLGGMAALGVAAIVTGFGFNWRLAFWFGVIIALVGGIARTALRETPVFVDAKRRIKLNVEEAGYNSRFVDNNSIVKDKVNKKTIIALFCVGCTWPVCFYFVYIYCPNILKNILHLTSEQVINQNFIVSIVHLISYLILTFLSYYVYPLKILRVKLVIFTVFILICPYLLNNIHNSFDVLLIQLFVVLFGFTGVPARPLYYKHFPVFKRFTYPSFIYALSRAITHVISSFGMIYVIKYFENWGLLLLIPTAICFKWSIDHFEKLEIEAGNYP
ncbi:sugar (and other) transporter family protein [Rickettsia felis str. Pedreira]|uniref:Sugar (And other) transporter family protein n=2 Tax=Rickettsia felis TaxID=42862 RepID=A0A0F3MQT8_RICFI|nr:MFS transporter [Rickettsia felis]AAY61292.1 MFS type sugar transporter [Rickettsia felis URRWXCal2]KHO02808.1 MFS transporter [Rickettsia felis str. LSU]KHO03749.1 MFS transporter [Rickettsia felis]KJV58041.1 sugar (and other) transporter family protein [Rickettsia felis str. Pedreira]MDE8611992.1 MFS transporter [Rickettsia felis]